MLIREYQSRCSHIFFINQLTTLSPSLSLFLSFSLSRTYRHAGNLLACPDGRLCYLDFGMMSYADTNQRNGFLLAVVVRLSFEGFLLSLLQCA
jgi:ABC1 atypical kinase-like domain